MLTPARCPARAPARASFRASRRHACRARRAWTTTAEAASPAASAPEPIRAPPGSRVYFAYGSNVNTKTMKGTRGITPSAAYPAVLPGYELVFNVPGLPFIEPAFASVRRVVTGKTDDAPSRFARFATETHGVAYVVTDEQWRTILRTETSYVREDVTLERFLPASTRVDGDAPPATPQKIFATTLVFADADVGGVALLPSARYLGLLREGADEWGLDPSWREYLRVAVRAYDPGISPPGRWARRWRRLRSRRRRGAAPRRRRRRGRVRDALELREGLRGGCGSVWDSRRRRRPRARGAGGGGGVRGGLPRVRGDDVGGAQRVLGAGVRVGRQQRRSPSEARLIRFQAK